MFIKGVFMIEFNGEQSEQCKLIIAKEKSLETSQIPGYVKKALLQKALYLNLKTYL